MEKLKVLAVVMAVVLVVSVGFSVYVGSQSGVLGEQKAALSRENESLRVRLELVSILSQAQVGVEADLHRIGGSLAYASGQVSAFGLAGDQVRVVLDALAANSSFTIETATQDLSCKMITVEPAVYRINEGKIIGAQKWLNVNPYGSILASMTPVLPLIVGFDGVAMAAPVFDLNKTLIGTMSIAFNHGALLNSTILPLLDGTGYDVTVYQVFDSKVIFDTDHPGQQGKLLFSDPIYAGYPELLALGYRFMAESSGYGTYSFTLSDVSDEVVQKECYWVTVSAFGAEWRIVMMHVLGE